MVSNNKVSDVSKKEFNDFSKKGYVLIDFFADWCAPCKMLTPILEEVAQEVIGQASIVEIDIDQAQAVAATFNITSVPTLILFKNGKEINRVVGIKAKDELKELLTSAG